MLGLSIPTTLDANAHTALEYVRSFNALLHEFETYQSVHPPEGGTNSLPSGSFGRSKVSKMFSRSYSSTGGSKNRRASTAADIGLPLPPGFDSADTLLGGMSNSSETPGSAPYSANVSASASSATLAGGVSGSGSGGIGSSAGNSTSNASSQQQQQSHTTALPAPDTATLLPGEEYTYLLTPSLPFEPDFFEVFATLAEVLIDVYMRIATLASSPEKIAMQPGLAEIFAKADARVRKVLVYGIVKEFEEATRAGVKAEMAGVGRVVLGGLM